MSEEAVKIMVSDKAMDKQTLIPAKVKTPRGLDELDFAVDYLNALVGKFLAKYQTVEVLDEVCPGTWIKVQDLLRKHEQSLLMMAQQMAQQENNETNEDNIEWVDVDSTVVGDNVILVPKISIANYLVLIKHIGVAIRYNEMSKLEEFILLDNCNIKFHGDIRDNAIFAFIDDEAHRVNFKLRNDKHLGFITFIANQNSYHPIRDWIESRPWDGVDRLPTFYNSVVLSEPHPLKDTLLRTWAKSAVAALYMKDGISSQGFIVFAGDQGIRKTTWVMSMVDESIPNAVGDGIILNPDKPDSVAEVNSFWIVELGELDATFKKADVEMLKAFISKKRDIYRPPYARKPNKYPRRTVMTGTVNAERYLQDETGNRRYWTMAVKELIPLHSLDIDIQQMWAQVKALYDENKMYWLNKNDMAILDNHNKRHTSINPIIDKLESYVVVTNEVVRGARLYSCTEILELCGVKNVSKSATNTCAKWLRDMGAISKNQGKRWQIELKTVETHEDNSWSSNSFNL